MLSAHQRWMLKKEIKVYYLYGQKHTIEDISAGCRLLDSQKHKEEF